VWSDAGYPASGAYRDYHHHTVHHHNPWSNDGRAYDHDAALALARRHAADFVTRTRARLDGGAGAREGMAPGGPLVVCALDTELLGHWWYEGVAWLEAVLDECARQGLALVRLDEAPQLGDPTPLGEQADEEATSWGTAGDLSTWSGPAVADMAFAARAAELALIGAGARAGEVAARELMALQASDWAFMVSRGLAVPYARERFEGHRARFERALEGDHQAGLEGLRNLAIHARPRSLRAP
jgi:1,4-alpha-glucan branching enzyme